MLTRMSGPLMISSEACARVVAGALTSRFPRPRYLVGLDARLYAVGNMVPTPLRDEIVRRVMGL
jgi:hypothetical protein